MTVGTRDAPIPVSSIVPILGLSIQLKIQAYITTLIPVILYMYAYDNLVKFVFVLEKHAEECIMNE